MAHPRVWDIFCRVIDNYGDAGVCWRLAADLGARGERARLWIDDPAPLAFMAPRGAAGVEVLAWSATPPALEPGDVVIEAFGCDPPPGFVTRMAARARPPVWLNLEHLSAESWVERSHGLPSPQHNGLTKWFYFPGFSGRTGGLLREPGLLSARAAFDRTAWLREMGIAPLPGERLVTLFCYGNPRLPDVLAALAPGPTLLLVTPGPVRDQLGAGGLPGPTRLHRLPWLDHQGFDRLLWSADLNVVRGEDSIVRAVWAGVPFVWHIYAQNDLAHAAKLDAFLDVFLDPPSAARDAGAAADLRALVRRLNGLEPGPMVLPPAPAWAAMAIRFRDRMAAHDDLVTQLQRFVAGKG